MADHGKDRQIDYIELNVSDIARAKAFYDKGFGWMFTEYGPSYCEFADGRLKGGFAAMDGAKPGLPLVILYADDLEATEKRLAARPPITVPTVVLHGADNGVAPARTSERHASLFGAAFERRVIPHVGHNVPQEAPDEFAAAVLALLTR